MGNTQSWYIVKSKNGSCQIVARETVDSKKQAPDNRECWGPFASPGEAIARRVGLIRAGKCQPE
ncbi:MAG: DDE transposase family protein [Oscillatoria sp. PMC 1068.18]|nr:DDE transposase family protein [Oscillatoria sp. PMC 1076.18]MEC4990184.1 DDE transposase family protein [Oscillatoria sp. PMC 1068.18]